MGPIIGDTSPRGSNGIKVLCASAHKDHVTVDRGTRSGPAVRSHLKSKLRASHREVLEKVHHGFYLATTPLNAGVGSVYCPLIVDVVQGIIWGCRYRPLKGYPVEHVFFLEFCQNFSARCKDSFLGRLIHDQSSRPLPFAAFKAFGLSRMSLLSRRSVLTLLLEM